MTTRLTDEKIRDWANALDATGCGGWQELARLLREVWLAERQAARDGVTSEMVDKALDAMYEQDWRTTTPDILRKNMRAAIQSVAQPVKVPEKKRVPAELSSATDYYNDGWNDAIDEMLSTLPQPQQSVLDLLALIHRDGGHYTGEHGIEKSIQDAFDKIAELRTQQAVPTSSCVEHGETIFAVSRGMHSYFTKDAEHARQAAFDGAQVREIRDSLQPQPVRVPDEMVRTLCKLAKHADDCLSHQPLPTGEGNWHCSCGYDSYVLDGEPHPSILSTSPQPQQALPDGEWEGFQAAVGRWMGQCFIPSLYSNMIERGDRLLEEVLELLQSHGYDKSRVATLVEYVFNRPIGNPAQEVGGVMITLAGYCYIAGLDMHIEGNRELFRIMQPEVMAKIRSKQEAKNALHFDTPLPGNIRRTGVQR